MMSISRVGAVAVAACAFSVAAFAPVALAGTNCNANCAAPVFGAGDATTTQAYAGINWAFGAGPELNLGVRSVRTNDRNKVVGAKFEATFPFSKQSVSFDKLRLRLITGNRLAMAELGGGYSFLGKGFLLSGAVQADYVVAGTDFTLNSFQWQPFVGLNTLARPDEGASGATCASGYALTPVGALPGSVFAASGQIVNGQTCFNGIDPS